MEQVRNAARGDTRVADEISRAIDAADLNVLRMAMLHATGDAELADLTVNREPLRGGTFFAYRLAAEHGETVREKAREWLARVLAGAEEDREDVDDSELRRLMRIMTGGMIDIDDALFKFWRDELALDDFPRSVSWSEERPASADGFRVAIVGAGASGIAAAVQLARLGIPFTILERQDRIGGTWNTNVYPDARVDVSSYLYQFKFVKNYPWGSHFAPQEEVRRYLEHVATEFGIDRHMQFGVEVLRAVWDEPTGAWTLELSDAAGARSVVQANAVVCATGLFNLPKTPDIPGLEDFHGTVLHSARWDPAFSPDDSRIAIIGNGSTGVQVMPKLAETARRVYAFQRTPQWISPMEGYRDQVAPTVQWLFDNVPHYWNWHCCAAQVTSSSMATAQEYDPVWQAHGGAISEQNDAMRENLTRYIREKLSGRQDLIDVLTPDYAPLARRLVVDNGWYDALLRDNVELITSAIERVTERGIATAGGAEYELDAIILATGFEVARYLWPTEYVGRGGITLEQQWGADGPRTYAGMMMPNFPNMFVFYGPNAQPRSGALLTAVEFWARYTAQSLVTLLERGGRAMEPTAEAFEAFNQRLDAAQENLIWAAEAPRGRNYYVNALGRQMLNTPWPNHENSALLEGPELGDFTLS